MTLRKPQKKYSLVLIMKTKINDDVFEGSYREYHVFVNYLSKLFNGLFNDLMFSENCAHFVHDV